MPRSEEVPDLPEAEDAFDETLLADVRRYGWHCVMARSEAHPAHIMAITGQGQLICAEHQHPPLRRRVAPQAAAAAA